MADTEAAEETARALVGLPAEWTVLRRRDLAGPQGRQVDHVAIGPGGVFVIDSLDWAGRVDVSDGVLRLNGRSRMSVANAVSAAADVLARRRLPGPGHGAPGAVLRRPGAVEPGRRRRRVRSRRRSSQTLLSHERVLERDELSSVRDHVASAFAQ